MVLSPDSNFLYVLTTTAIIKYDFTSSQPLNPQVIYTPGMLSSILPQHYVFKVDGEI